MKNKLVICNYADKCKNRCAKHGYPHEVVKISSPKCSCTEWVKCYINDEKGKMVTKNVRCVGVKG